MGPQRVFQAAVVLVAIAGSAAAKPHERVAVIDLGPSDPALRAQLAKKLVAAGFEPVVGDGVDDALAGERVDTDAVQLAAAMAEAQRAFGALDCKAATASANQAIGFAAARQAAGLPAPELARASAYLLLCADRLGDIDAAMTAAARVRAAGGSADVPVDVLKKYPELDAIGNRELVPMTITAEVAGAEIWIDFKRAGTSPLDVQLLAGDHVIAAASGSKRGWAAGTAVKSQTALAVPMPDRAGTWSEVAARVASWKGVVPSPADLGWVMAKVRARVVLVRKGTTLEAFGRLGLAEAPHKLGGEDTESTVAEADRVIALVNDRVHTWNDRAPDPDRPLVLDDGRERDRDGKLKNPPTRWWVYASIAGAVVAGAAIIYATDASNDRQRVELHVP